MSTTNQIKQEAPLPFNENELVEVIPRTWVGICKYGGAATVKKCYHDKGRVVVDVKYTNESRTEKGIEVNIDDSMDSNLIS